MKWSEQRWPDRWPKRIELSAERQKRGADGTPADAAASERRNRDSKDRWHNKTLRAGSGHRVRGRIVPAFQPESSSSGQMRYISKIILQESQGELHATCNSVSDKRHNPNKPRPGREFGRRSNAAGLGTYPDRTPRKRLHACIGTLIRAIGSINAASLASSQLAEQATASHLAASSRLPGGCPLAVLRREDFGVRHRTGKPLPSLPRNPSVSGCYLCIRASAVLVGDALSTPPSFESCCSSPPFISSEIKSLRQTARPHLCRCIARPPHPKPPSPNWGLEPC